MPVLAGRGGLPTTPRATYSSNLASALFSQAGGANTGKRRGTGIALVCQPSQHRSRSKLPGRACL